MAVFRKVGFLSKQLFTKNTPLIYITRKYEKIAEDNENELGRRTLAPDINNLLPGKYPKTEKERREAAAKYNMHPDEYKPYPNDWRYAGDYPELPWISNEAKDPYYPWDFPDLKRNLGEPIHREFDMLGEDRSSAGVRKLISDRTGAYLSWLIFAVYLIIAYSAGDTSQPMMNKQYPGEGRHYTFELVK